MGLDGLAVLRVLTFGVLIMVALSACAGSDEETPRDAAVWTTSDGTDWARVRHPSLGGRGEQQMTAAVRFGSRLVAAGFEIVDGERDARIWTSQYGEEWRLITDPELGGPGEQSIWAITAAGPGLVAVGTTGDSEDTDAAVWVSSDGLDWVQVPSTSSFTGRGDQAMNAITVYDGLIVAAGFDYTNAAAWTSEDGFNWSPMKESAFGGDGEQKIWGLTPAAPGLIAVGEDDRDATAWILDGSAWTQIQDQTALGGDGHQLMQDVTELEGLLVAVGGAYLYDEIYFLGRGLKGALDAMVWTSDDGINWDRVDDQEDVFGGRGGQVMHRVMVWESRLMGVGYDLARGGNVEEGLAVFGSGLDVDAAVWASSDGLAWTKVSSRALGGEDWQDIWDVVVVPEVGVIAVGGDDLGTPPSN